MKITLRSRWPLTIQAMEMSLKFIAEHIGKGQSFKAVSLMGLDTGDGFMINASGSSNSITLMANGSTVKGFNLTGSGHCGCGVWGYRWYPAITRSSIYHL